MVDRSGKKDLTVEEIERQIEELKRKQEQMVVQIREAKQRSVAEAIGKAGAEFEEKYKEYISRMNSRVRNREQIAKLTVKDQEDAKWLAFEYKPIRDTLVGAGAKEEYLAEFIGEAPTVKKAAVPGVSKRRTKAKLPDGSTMTWVELSDKYGVSRKEGANQRPVWFTAAAANPSLPRVEVVDAETGEAVVVE